MADPILSSSEQEVDKSNWREAKLIIHLKRAWIIVPYMRALIFETLKLAAQYVTQHLFPPALFLYFFEELTKKSKKLNLASKPGGGQDHHTG